MLGARVEAAVVGVAGIADLEVVAAGQGRDEGRCARDIAAGRRDGELFIRPDLLRAATVAMEADQDADDACRRGEGACREVVADLNDRRAVASTGCSG